MFSKKEKELLSFLLLSIPFSLVNGVVWGVGIITIPILAKTVTRAGLSFAMINLGIAVGAIFWGFLSNKIKVNILVFLSCLLSFTFWTIITLLKGKFIVVLSLFFGTASGGIFALSSVAVTQRYQKFLWEKYISLMQAIMTAGTVAGLLITSTYPSAIVGIPLLAIALLSYLPSQNHNNRIATNNKIHTSIMKPKMHFSELFTCYFHKHFKIKHFSHLTKNRDILILNLQWALSLLSVAPVYAIYPIFMKDAFEINPHMSSLIYAISTAIGVYLFIIAGNLAKRKYTQYPLKLAMLLYFITFILMGVGLTLHLQILGVLGFMTMIFSWSFISVGMNVSIVEKTKESNRAELLGVANALQSVDNMTGGTIAGPMVSLMGSVAIIIFGLVLSSAANIINNRFLFKKEA